MVIALWKKHSGKAGSIAPCLSFRIKILQGQPEVTCQVLEDE
jgi:hypothetical protein